MSETPNLELENFARRFHALIDYEAGTENFVSSPLGAWILLAQTAGPNPGGLTSLQRDRIQEWLGCDITTAYNHLDRLLRDVPEAVKLAIAAWFEPLFGRGVKELDWRNNLLAGIETGEPIPTKAALDAWAEENTLGIIPQFPMDESDLENASLLFANALATKIKWRKPFTEVDNTLNHWRVEKLLHTSGSGNVKFTRDLDGNLYAVVRNGDVTGLEVYAVIAENRELGPQHVIEFAENYAAAGYRAAVDINELPTQGDMYTLTDIVGTSDTYSAVLPAWMAESKFNLMKMNMPFAEAIRAVTDADIAGLEAVQVAKAEYNKLGFEAAAISAMVMRAAGLPVTRPHKQVDVRFDRPFAVVAAYSPVRRDKTEPASPWANLPLFSAWVHKATPVSDKSFD